MAIEGFEQEIPAIERMQANASEHTVTGNSKVLGQTAENSKNKYFSVAFNPLNPELNPIC